MTRPISAIVAASLAVAPMGSAVAASSSHTVARAEPANPEAVAKGEKLRQQAIEAFQAGDLTVAVEKFEAAYAADPSPAYLFNIGRVYEEMGDLEKAVEYYERFSRQPHLELQERQKAAERIEVLRKLIGPGSGTREPDPVEPTEPVGPTETVAEPDPDPDPTPGSDSAPRPSRPLILAGSSLLGVGAAIALGGGVGLGLAARNRSRRVEDISPGVNPEGLTLAEVEDLDAQGRTFELYQFVTVAAGGSLAVVGAALLGVGMARRSKQRAVTMFGRPSVGRSAAGLVVGGRF